MRLFRRKKAERLPDDTVINEETGMMAGDVNFKIISFLMLTDFFFIFLWFGTLRSPWSPLILDIAVFLVLISALLFSSLYQQTKMHIYLIYIALFANVIATVLSVCKIAIPLDLFQIPSSVMVFINILQVLLLATFVFRIVTELHISTNQTGHSNDD